MMFIPSPPSIDFQLFIFILMLVLNECQSIIDRLPLSIDQHKDFVSIEFDDGLDDHRQYNQKNVDVFDLILRSNNPRFDRSLLHLERIEIFRPRPKVFAIKSDGQIDEIHNYSKSNRYLGHIYGPGWNVSVPIEAMGSISKSSRDIFLVIKNSHFYITPSLSKLSDQNHHRFIEKNLHVIFDEQQPHSIGLLSSLLLDHYDLIEKIGKQQSGRRRIRRRDSNDRGRVINDNKRDDGDVEDSILNFCGIKLIILNDMYEKFDSDISLIVQHSQHIIDFINDIFLKHKWTRSGFYNESIDYDSALKGYGIILCNIYIQTELPKRSDPFDLVSMIEEYSDKNFCLTHIFTTINLTHKTRIINGLTSTNGIFNDKNCGISSFNLCSNFWENYCILSIVHEFGHSFGSAHDIDDEECWPNEGGSYLMSDPFLTELGPNNFRFSPCSVRAIYFAIKRKKKYFINSSNGSCQSQNRCGNNIVENGEECDEGANGGLCCDNHCRLKSWAQCSSSQKNAFCCDSRCRIMPQGQICRPNDLRFCLDQSRCDGQNYSCPKRTKLSDGTRCSDGGVCRQGFCETCQQRCDCDIPCYSCCYNRYKQICERHLELPDGSRCLFNESHPGQCRKGMCEMLNIIYIPPRMPDLRPELPRRDETSHTMSSNPDVWIDCGFWYGQPDHFTGTLDCY
ncbi:hypothetical protein SSS_00461 [Sarcoptes scabiei]|nr:hypothetical protein SSS_00461 [Sarcoptes scabiei]